MVANVASGSVGPGARAELEAIFESHGVAVNIRTPAGEDLEQAVRDSIEAGPDLLAVLAGDGTARLAAELSGMRGPPIAPLAGGTMNMLPHAVYGQRPWQEALEDTLARGEVRTLGGGCVGRHRFLVAAILGAPALWAPAREAARSGRLRLAAARAREALDRAFSGRLRYALDGGPREKTEALVLMCPIASRAMNDEDRALEAAALNIRGAGEALRLGVNAIVGDWRTDPAVENRPCHVARVWSAHDMPALLDGETVRLEGLVEVRYQSEVCRVIAPPPEAA